MSAAFHSYLYLRAPALVGTAGAPFADCHDSRGHLLQRGLYCDRLVAAEALTMPMMDGEIKLWRRCGKGDACTNRTTPGLHGGDTSYQDCARCMGIEIERPM